MILTTLWCIWFHRNQVILEGKPPNPMETVLTTNSFMNRYMQPADDIPQIASHSSIISKTHWPPDTNWQILITTAGGGSKHCKLQGIAYIGKNREGQVLFAGCQSTRLQDNRTTRATTIQEATIKVVSLGFTKIIILVGSKDMENMWKGRTQYSWQLSPFFEDLKYLKQHHELQLHIKTSYRLILSEAHAMAIEASK